MQKGGQKRNGTKGPVTAATTQCHATRPMYHEILGEIYRIWIEIVDSRGSFFVHFPLCNDEQKVLVFLRSASEIHDYRLLADTTFPYTINLVKSTCNTSFRL